MIFLTKLQFQSTFRLPSSKKKRVLDDDGNSMAAAAVVGGPMYGYGDRQRREDEETAADIRDEDEGQDLDDDDDGHESALPWNPNMPAAEQDGDQQAGRFGF